MNKFLLTVITVLLTMVAGALGYITVKVLDVDRSVVAMKQHLVDQGWRPVAAVPPPCLPQDRSMPVKASGGGKMIAQFLIYIFLPCFIATVIYGIIAAWLMFKE